MSAVQLDTEKGYGLDPEKGCELDTLSKEENELNTEKGHESDELDTEKEYNCGNKHRLTTSCVQRAGTVVSEGLERFFYKFGYAIASKPWTVVLCTFFVSALFGLGMIRFEQKDSSEPIWVPEDSVVLSNEKWVENNFPVKHRYNMYIVTANNVLEPAVIKQMYKIDKSVKDLQERNNSESSVLNFNWTSLCIRISGQCWSNSILQLWNFNELAIDNIQTKKEVLDRISYFTSQGTSNTEFVPSNWLGDISYDEAGEIIGAKAAKMLYVIQATSTDEMNTKILGPDLLWETKFIELGLKFDQTSAEPIRNVSVSAVRSFRDESDNSFENDVVLLMAGVGIIVTYVTIILGKFNELEHKVYLALVGVFGIGLASLVSYGMASAIGMFYGPIHPILPFLLLGLGVDDMFVIIEAWNNLTIFERKKDLRVQVAIALQHAGVSITVTSITDFVAFSIGATTTLPALKSFCVYAALGIISLFIIQSSFFVAWLTIDQRRQDTSRDACCIWIKYVNFKPNQCSQSAFLPWFLEKYFSPSLLSLPIKTFVTSLLIGMLAISGYGTYMLKTDSDLAWFLPRNSYFTTFLETQEEYFNRGIMVNLYLGEIDYFRANAEIYNMTSELEDSKFVIANSMTSWQAAFNMWLKDEGEFDKNLIDENSYPIGETEYYLLLDKYLMHNGRQYLESVKWNDTDNKNFSYVMASKISFMVKKLDTSDDDTEALNFFEDLCKRYFPNKSFVWAVQFRTWETNRVIQRELYVNIGLAFAAVFVVTLLLVANLFSCILVCVCVIFTLVNVCGFMHFWGLTIDTLTSILLILSIGLAIDYSAHIGHKFMTIYGNRNERAKHTVTTIGPAVINGGFSTFLAFILLSTSSSYVFSTFFKVFFLVVVFGLFNGVCVLPVLLSWMGPPPYLNAKNMTPAEESSVKLHTSSATHLPNELPALHYTVNDVSSKSESPILDKDFKEKANDNSISVDRCDPQRMLVEPMNHTSQESSPLLKENSFIHQPLSCEQLIKDCEEYLEAEKNGNDKE